MKSRTIILLWLVAIALGASIFLVKKSQGRGQDKATNRAPGQKLIANFPAEKVSVIEISGATDSVTLQEKNGKWTVSQRDAYPANTRTINELLRTISELKVTQAIEAGTSFAPRFGMDESSLEAAQHGLTATFKDSSGKDLAEISFGKNLDSAGSSSAFGGGGATGRFVRNHADESGFYAVSELFGTLTPDPKSWLADEFLRVEKIETISITKPGSDDNEWTLIRDDEEADFNFTDAFPGVKIDPAAITPLKSLFSFARFDDVVPAADVEKISTPEQLSKVKIVTFEGFEYDIVLQPTKAIEGKPATGNFLMTVAVSAKLPKERKKPEGEKEEDAKKADEAFSERLKTLTERLEKTKKLEGRTYEVSPFTVDAIRKSRTDLMLKTPAPTPPGQGASAFTPPIEIPARPAPTATEAPEAE